MAITAERKYLDFWVDKQKVSEWSRVESELDPGAGVDRVDQGEWSRGRRRGLGAKAKRERPIQHNGSSLQSRAARCQEPHSLGNQWLGSWGQ